MRNAGLALTAVAALLLLSAGTCDNPTEPLRCVDLTPVFAAEQFYNERSERITELPGRLTKNCPAPTPGGRDHCYFLGPVAVYSGSKGEVLDRFVGREVLIMGKVVDVGFGPEIWPGTICRFP